MSEDEPEILDDPKVKKAIESTEKAMPTETELKNKILADSPDDKQVLFTEEEAVEGESLAEPEYGELENMLIICEQCGSATLVLSGDKLPARCMCGLEYDYENESVTTEFQIEEQMVIAVRKVPRKFHPR